MSGEPVKFAPSVARWVFFLVAVAVGLVLASVACQVLYYRFGIVHLDFFKEFYVGEENNLPTFFTSALFLAGAVLLGITGSWSRRLGDDNAKYWYVLMAAFLYVAVDESVSLHERLTKPMQEMGATGWLHFGWVIPAGICVLVLGLFMLKFFCRLEMRTRLLFVISAILYLSGALGVEMLGARYYEHGSHEAFMYLALVTVEESLEMAGVLLFLYAMLDYVRRHLVEFSICPGR